MVVIDNNWVFVKNCSVYKYMWRVKPWSRLQVFSLGRPPPLSLLGAPPPLSLTSHRHMVELRSGRCVETEKTMSTSGARVDTSRGRTPERLEAPAPPALPPPRIREFRNPAKVKIGSSCSRVFVLFDSDHRQRYQMEGIVFLLCSDQFLI
ncbi:hypothetical protein Taro_029087, partial [Colocasia esculenta]|nr:hypothetical protein [Colocasia esculenta]